MSDGCNCNNVQIAALEDGPVLVVIGDTKLALCRCGQTGNKPYCDGKHKAYDFKGEAIQLWPELTSTEGLSAA